MAVMIFHNIILVALLRVSQGQDAVIISPSTIVAAVNNSVSHTFTCSSPIGLNEGGIASLQWLLNGMFLEELNLTNVVSFVSTRGSGFGTLTFSRVRLDQNASSVLCTVHFTSGRVENSSDSTLLLVQGLPSAVDVLNITVSNTTLSLTWEPPFTLDITGEDPDITGYCVDVVNSISSVTLHSQCDITMTEFSYPLPQDAVCHRFVLTITPVNVVGRGVSSSVLYIGTEAGPSDVLVVERMSESDVTNDKQVFSFIISMSAPVCVAEVISLVNLDTGTQESVADSELTITENFAIMFIIPLPVNHHYNFTIRARNGAGTTVTFSELSTHDIKTAEIFSSTINITYFNGSNARGALLSQVCIDTIANVSTSILQTLHKSQHPIPYNHMALRCSGPVQIFLYDIEQSGVLSRGGNYPAVKQRVKTDRQLQGSGPPILRTDVLPGPVHLRNCSVETFPLIIRAKCAYAGESDGFQVVVQPATFDQLGKLYAMQASEGQTSVTVELEQNGVFLVSVIPVLGKTGIVNSSVEYTEVVVVEDLLTATGISPSNEEYVLPVAISLGVVAIVVTISMVVMFLRICARRNICCFTNKENSSARPENDYGTPPCNTLPTTEPNGEGELSVTVLDPEQLQQQAEHVHVDSQQDALPQKEEISEGRTSNGSPHAVVVDVGEHYAALNLSAQAEGENMMIRDTDIVYSTAVGFKNKNSNYAFVDPTSRTTSEAVNLHEISRDFLDGVVYSAIVPQESVKGKKKKKPPPPPPPPEENDSATTEPMTTQYVYERLNGEACPLIDNDLVESKEVNDP